MSEKEKIVILGGGVGGLAAGYFLARTDKYTVTVLEKAPVIGGLSGSFEHDGFVLDYGAHKIYSVIPGIMEEIESLMGDRLVKHPKRHRLFLRGKLVDYPLRLSNLARALGLGLFLRIGFGFAVALLRGIFDRTPPRSYEAYMLRQWGRPAYDLVFGPLAEKVWSGPESLHPNMAKTRMPPSNGLDIVLRMLRLKEETEQTSAEYFLYPRKGFGDWPQALRESIEAHGGEVFVNVADIALQVEDRRIVAVNAVVGEERRSFSTDYVVSSIPLPIIGRMLFTDHSDEIDRMVADLQFRHLILAYLFVEKPKVMQDHWIFVPEREIIFSRLFEQKLMSEELGPPHRTALCCDFTCDEDSQLWQASDEELAQRCIQDLEASGFITAEEVSGYHVVRRRNFYPRYDLEYPAKLKAVNRKLQEVENLMLTGRIGMYNYNNSDHCADMGRFIAQNLVAGETPGDIWRALEKRVANYRIID